MNDRPTVFIGISHGFHVRNFIQTPFIKELAKRFSVVFVLDHRDAQHLSDYLNKAGLTGIAVEGISVSEKKYENTFLLLRKNIFVSPKRAGTKNILNEMNSQTLGKWGGVLHVLNKIFGTYDFTRSLWRFTEGVFIDGSEFNNLFEKYKPAAVIAADYGTRPFEIRLLRAARRHGVKSISVVPSWDNLTSKGVMGIKPDFLSVWNDIMKEEAVELHGFKAENIFISGPVQFDNFFNADYRLSEGEFRKKFGVKEGQKVIVYGTITPQYFKYNFEVLSILRQAIESGQIPGNPKVIVRIHPQVVSDPVYGDKIERYQELVTTTDIFSLSLPAVESWGTMQVPGETDYRDLISILTYADVSIASASTLIFDSFACKTPFVGIGFDGYQTNLPRRNSVRRMFEFEHYKHVYKMNGFRIAESGDDLIRYVNDYIMHPEHHQKERELTLEHQIRFLDGRNYERVMQGILRVVDRLQE